MLIPLLCRSEPDEGSIKVIGNNKGRDKAFVVAFLPGKQQEKELEPDLCCFWVGIKVNSRNKIN